MKKLAALALTAALTAAGSAQGAIVYLSTDGTTTNGVANQPTANPTLTLQQGETATLYVLGKRSGASGSVNSLGLNIAQQSGNGGSLTATNWSINDPEGTNPDGDPIKRWQGTAPGTLNTPDFLVFDSKAFAVSGTFNQTLAGNLRLHGTLTFTATTPGTVNLFLQVGSGTISETNGSTTSTFGRNADGSGDDPTAVNNALIGAASQIADAVITITPIPEPASMSLLGLGAAALLGRRRRA